MQNINVSKSGFIFGSFMGLWHLVWSFMVGVGIAQGLLDWIYGLYFLNNPFQVTPFSVLNALYLIVVTTLIGFGGGCFFAFLWNKFHK